MGHGEERSVGRSVVLGDRKGKRGDRPMEHFRRFIAASEDEGLDVIPLLLLFVRLVGSWHVKRI